SASMAGPPWRWACTPSYLLLCWAQGSSSLRCYASLSAVSSNEQLDRNRQGVEKVSPHPCRQAALRDGNVCQALAPFRPQGGIEGERALGVEGHWGGGQARRGRRGSGLQWSRQKYPFE